MSTLSSSYLTQQLEAIHRAEVKARLAQLKTTACCPTPIKTEGTVQPRDTPYSTVYTASKIAECSTTNTIPSISPGGMESGIYSRNRLIALEQEPIPIQVLRVTPPAPCVPLSQETWNAGMPFPTPILPCVPHIVGFT